MGVRVYQCTEHADGQHLHLCAHLLSKAGYSADELGYSLAQRLITLPTVLGPGNRTGFCNALPR